MSRLITARFDSDCDSCGAEILEGDDIGPDGDGGWVCEDCAEDE